MLVFRGLVVSPVSWTELALLEDHVLGVDEASGVIAFCEPASALPQLQATHGFAAEHVRVLNEQQLLFPGFVDAHTHAPQFPNVGVGIDLPLLEWLRAYTFPTESKYADVDFAHVEYARAVRRTLAHGTTTCVYFGTIHRHASVELARICAAAGQRAFVGKVCMDRNAPDFYIEETAASVADTHAFADDVAALGSALVQPVVTPRFVPTCTSALMRQLGDLARERDLCVQSHVSENLDEVAWVRDLHPEHPTYTHVYHAHGLLRRKCVMAHGVYLKDEELALYRETGASVVHCPNSNYAIRSGVLDVRRLLNAGVNVCMGTDVSGGFSPSMLNAVQCALIASRSCESLAPGKPASLTPAELVYMATAAGAHALGLGDRIGKLAPGFAFDALVVDIARLPGGADASPLPRVADRVLRFLLCGDDRNVAEVYVGGRRVAL